jgi:SSS family solute:Na+ symporter
MAQNLWMAIFAWSTCFVVTLLVSLATPARPEEELRGLVYSLTPRVIDAQDAWYKRPGMLACIVGAFVIILNVIFW